MAANLWGAETFDEFFFVAGGRFQMGAKDGSSYADEEFVHPVEVSSFYMSPVEVTLAEFRRFVKETNYKTDAEKGGGSMVLRGKIFKPDTGANWKNPGFFQKDNEPVTCLSWYDAVEYCNYMSRKMGLTPCYTRKGNSVTFDIKANGYRLPTAAEWEYAARGGAKTKGTKYAGSNSAAGVAWYDRNSGKRTHPVGTKSPNELGLYDMTGNVAEWCYDWFDQYYYLQSPLKNPTGPKTGRCRAMRGGGWYTRARNSRPTQRFARLPGEASTFSGLRLVRN